MEKDNLIRKYGGIYAGTPGVGGGRKGGAGKMAAFSGGGGWVNMKSICLCGMQHINE